MNNMSWLCGLVWCLCMALPAAQADSPSAPADDAVADTASAAPLLQALRERADDFQRLRIPFTMEKHLAMLAEPLTNEGLLAIDRQRQAIRWEFTGESLFLLNDGELRRFGREGAEESLGAEAAGRSISQQMQALLSGDWQHLEELFVLHAADSRTLVGRPKDEAVADHVRELRVRFSEDLTAPEETVLTGASGDTTHYLFAEPAIDPDLDPELFTAP